MLSPLIQSVISLFADPVVVCSVLAPPNTFVEIDFEIFATVFLLLPLIQEGLLSVTNTQGTGPEVITLFSYSTEDEIYLAP